MRASLSLRMVALLAAALLTLVAVLVLVLVPAQLDRVAGERAERLSYRMTAALAGLPDIIAPAHHAALRTMLTTLALDPDVRVALLVDGEGGVLIDAARRHEGRPLAQALSAEALAAVQSAGSRRAGQVVAVSGNALLAAYPVTLADGGSTLRPSTAGTLVLDYDLSAARRAAYGYASGQIGALALVALALGAIIQRVLDREVTQPLARFRHVVEGVRAGRLDGRVGKVRGAEFDELASAFDGALDTVASQHAALVANERRLLRTQALARVFNLEWCPGHGELRLSDSFWELAGCARPVVVDRTALLAVVHEQDRGRIAACLPGAATELRAVATVFRVVGAGDRWFELRGDVAEESGGDRRLLALGHDITDRQRAQEQERALNAQLRQAQKMEAIGLLAGGIAHDFNNILASMLGYAELARQRAGRLGDQRAVDYLGEIVVAGERGRAFIAQLLTFSRGQGGTLAPLSPTPLIEEVGRLLKPLLPAAYTIDVRGEDDLPEVMAEPGLLQQVVLNLCINARDAMPDGGCIEVSLARRRVTSRRCASCLREFAGEFVMLTVRDHGQGIAAAHLERIFDPFFTTKEAGVRGANGVASGSGLGLSVVHGNVHQLGGHVEVDSAPGAGTAFCVYLPCVHGSVAERVVADAG